MQKVNKLGEVLGPVGSIAGYFFTIVGITQLFNSYKAIIFIVFGLFISFTSFVAFVDFDAKRYRGAVKLFGIFIVVKWKIIDSTLGLRIKRTNRAWRTYSASNRSFSISDSNFLIELVDSQGKSVADIERFRSIKEALLFYSMQLGLPIDHSAM
ncbi:MAG TPA: hypothetical protein ENN49_04925 [Bacteroidales bacterium]|nr:hypothetical protein [Bacteroidales bacterium]